MNNGWISLHRKIKDHWIWDDPVKFKWFIDILLTVNHSPNTVNIGFQLFECDRGQSVRSLKTWADNWKTTKDVVRNFFALLEKDNMIITENLKKTTRLTVCNYDSYQSILHDEPMQSKRKVTTKPLQNHPNNNENKENNENNSLLTDSFLKFWDSYNKKVGSKEKIFKKWCKLSNQERDKIFETLPTFLKAIKDKQFQPFPETYLNNKRWNDEITVKPQSTGFTPIILPS